MKKKILFSLGLIAAASPIAAVISCNGSNNSSKKETATKKDTSSKVAEVKNYPELQRQAKIIREKLTEAKAKELLKGFLDRELDIYAKLNADNNITTHISYYKDDSNKPADSTLEKSEVTDVHYANGLLSFVMKINYEEDGVIYKIVETAKDAAIKVQDTQGSQQIGIKVDTYQTNNRISNASKGSRTTHDVISARRLFGKWDDALEGMDDISKEKDTVQDITLFHTNDTHGRMYWDDFKYNRYIGMVNLAGFVESTPHDLFLSGGDFMQGTGISNYDDGERAMKIANIMGYDAIAAGNHEFDFDYTKLRTYGKSAPIYSLNSIYNKAVSGNGVNKAKGDQLLPGVRTKLIKGDLQVGIIALTTPDTAIKASPKYIRDIEIQNMATEAQKAVDHFESAGINLVILVGHMGDEEAAVERVSEVIKKTRGIDLVIDGHSHILYEPGKSMKNKDGEDVPLGQNGAYTRHIGKMQFDFNRKTGHIENFRNKYYDLNDLNNPETLARISNTPNAKAAAAIVEVAKTEYGKYAKKAAFTMPHALLDSLEFKAKSDLVEGSGKDTPVRSVRTFESTAGDFFADAMLWEALANAPKELREDKDASKNTILPIIGITNSGGVRTSIDKGQVTYGDIINISPFNNTLELLQATGKQLWAIFAHSAYAWKDGPFLQVSKNMVVKYDVYSDPKKSKVTSIKINGVEVPKDATKSYLISTNDFLKLGGDGYKTLTTTLTPQYSGRTLSNILIDYGTALSSAGDSDEYSWKLYEDGALLPSEGKRIIITGKDDQTKAYIKEFNDKAKTDA